MVITTYAKSGLGLLMTGSGIPPAYCGVGTGSAAEVTTLGSLITPFGARNLWSERDPSTVNEVNWIFNYDSVTMSGCNLKEFGMGVSIASGANDLWNREGFAAINFDGTNELQISITYQIF